MVDSTQTIAPDFHWPVAGESGTVPVDSLVPDPNQPRQHFSPLELADLGESMKSVGGQREILTVRALTNEERKSGQYPKGARYQIVSGERRWRVAIKVKVTTIDIRVRAYASYAEQFLDAWVMNERRVELSDWENALALRRMIDLFGWKTQEEMAKGTGKYVMWISQHLAYLRVHPDVQARMHPEIPSKERLKGPVVLFFGRLEHILQGELIAAMPREFTTVREQINWIKGELKSRGISLSTRKKRPSRAREMLLSFLKYVGGRAQEFEGLAEFSQLFENVPEAQIEETIKKLRDIDKDFKRLVTRVEFLAQSRRVSLGEAAKAEAPPTVAHQPRAPTSRQERPPAPPPTRGRGLFIPPVPPPQPREKSRGERPVIGMDLTPRQKIQPPASAIPAAAQSNVVQEVTVIFFHPHSGRETLDKVSLRRYIELWDLGALKFQRTKGEKPMTYPTREEAESRMA
jgi:ParB/RepB/Spo0J family partition protein